MRVLRWSQSAYETDADLAAEVAGLAALGATWELHLPRDVAPSGLEAVDVLVVTSRVRVGQDQARAMAGRTILTTTSGYDHIDLAACRAHGVRVGRSPDARRDPVVEHSVASALWLLRGLAHLDHAARRGRWARADLPALAPRSVGEVRVGIVGLGVIGQAAVPVWRGLGAEVLAYDPAAPSEVWQRLGLAPASLEAVLAGSDVLVLHCSLTPSSHHLIDAHALAKLPAGAIVINPARGECVDLPAAITALDAGRLAGLASDVFETEPYPELLQSASRPNLLLTPHSAGYTHDLGRRVVRSLLASVRAVVDGKPLPHPVALG